MSISVSISLSGLDLEVLAKSVPSEVLPAFVDRLAELCFQVMYRRAPWRSGFLAMSITKEVNGLTAKVGPTVPYAAFVSQGTGPHDIYPVKALALAFLGGSLGGLVFTKHVRHPGTRANPYIKDTADETVDNVQEVFHGVWTEYVET